MVGATYRIQLSPSFGFDAAAAVAPYLATLGVTHVYTSPYLQAVPGSTHGYDVADPTRLSDDLGGPSAHRRMLDAFAAAGLGHVVDVVPNHMATHPANAWWWDVLENGQASPYAAYFDIDWDPPDSELRDKVLLAVLGDHYGRILDRGELEVAPHRDRLRVHYHDQVFPISADSLAALTAEGPGPGAPSGRGPGHGPGDLQELADRLNGDRDLLHRLLELQHYRLAYWRTAGQEIDYRRFFDIQTLVGLRVEEPQVFEDSHALVLGWVRAGLVQGLRIDHPDGLANPGAYLERLRAAVGEAWVVIEKILEPGEALPDGWPVAGTTGYDFAARAGGLFVDPAGLGPLGELHAELTGNGADFGSVARAAKREVLGDALAADLRRLTELAVRVCQRHRRYRDYTRAQLSAALVGLTVALPIYRTYVVPGAALQRPEDARYIDRARAEAEERSILGGAQGGPLPVGLEATELDDDLWDFLARVLRGEIPGAAESALALRWQQLTAPVTAKGVEDTALYRYVRLVSANEVGSDPEHPAVSPEEFHRANDEAQRLWPSSMLSTSTHDTKRSEDVRARIALLSEIPAEWAATARRWFARAEPHRRGGAPEPTLEYLLYQSVVGAWPISTERLAAYAAKAACEAKMATSWTRPDPVYDEGLAAFVTAVLDDADFVDDIDSFVAPLVEPGRVTSMAQTLLRLTCPGVPDTYQGTEVWDLSLVDPDNRRPVDFDRRRQLLSELERAEPSGLWARADDGLPKLAVVRAALDLRRRRPDCFGPKGAYRPLPVSGGAGGHAVAYVRGEDEVAVVVPRLVLSLRRRGGWDRAEVALPEARMRDLVTGAVLDGGPTPVAELLERFPVVLLERV